MAAPENRNIQKPPTLVSTGFLALDVVWSTDDGAKTPNAALFAGGTCGNVSTWLASLGWNCIPVGRLGDCNATEVLIRDLERFGVSLDFVRMSESAYPPQIICQENRIGKDGLRLHRFSTRCPACRRRLPAFRPITIEMAEAIAPRLPRPDVFFFDRLSPGIAILMEWALEAGAVLVFEPSSTPDGRSGAEHDRYVRALQVSHIVRYGDGRIADMEEAVGIRPTAALEIQTLGERGLRCRGTCLPDLERWRALLPELVPRVVVDSAGCGDRLTASLIDNLCRPDSGGPDTWDEQTVREILARAQIEAARNTTVMGSRGSMYGKEPPVRLPLPDAMAKLCGYCQSVATADLSMPEAPDQGIGAFDDPWTTSGRPGYVGRKVGSARQQLDTQYGARCWRIAYAWRGGTIPREQALEHYAEAYYVFLRDNPDILTWLVRTASDVYDLSPTDVESGTDFSIQTGSAHHLQDIAIRRALNRLGRVFEGDHLVRIRGRRSEGARLSPGVVPFHRPEEIEEPQLRGWWRRDTVEACWQSNKVLQIRRPRVLFFGASFNPIHNGHIALARYVRNRLWFDEIVFVPNGDNYRKAGLAPAGLRLAMVRATVESETGFKVSDVEVRSSTKMRTVTTARELRDAYPEHDLYILRGLDALARTHHRLFDIEGLRVLVIDRFRFPKSFDAVVDSKAHLRANRHRLDYSPGAFTNPISATQVREAIAAGESIAELVPAPVAGIIQANGLYRAMA